MAVATQIGERVRLYRHLRQLSQRELAVAAEIDEATVWRIENGKVQPSLETLLRLTDALQTTVENLAQGGPVD